MLQKRKNIIFKLQNTLHLLEELCQLSRIFTKQEQFEEIKTTKAARKFKPEITAPEGCPSTFVIKMKSPSTLPPLVINFFFALGLISALSFRALIVIKDLRPDLFRPVWYLGIIGYLAFFMFRYAISRKRRRAITDFNLLVKIKTGSKLSKQDREAITYLLSSIQKSRENLNYLFIFATSAIAILLDLWLI